MKKILNPTTILILIVSLLIGVLPIDAQPIAAESNTGLIGGKVFEDANQDGQSNLCETGIPNVLIRLKGLSIDQKTIEIEVKTDENGWYFFRNLPSGSYEVQKISQPAGYQDGSEHIEAFLILDNLPSGNNLNIASNPNAAGVIAQNAIRQIPLRPGQEAVGYHFGQLNVCGNLGARSDCHSGSVEIENAFCAPTPAAPLPEPPAPLLCDPGFCG